MGLTITDAKREILALLHSNPRHGYAIAKELGKQPPTVYEHLQALEDSGYVKSEEEGRRRIYSLDEKGELLIQMEEIDDEQP